MNSDWLLAIQFAEKHPQDAARVLEKMNTEQSIAFFDTASSLQAAVILQNMDRNAAVRCLETMAPGKTSALFSNMPSPVVAAFLRTMDISTRDPVLSALPETNRKAVAANLRYRENTVGAMMNTGILAIPDDILTKEALKRIKKYKQYIHTHIYVTNRDNKFVGLLKFRDILFAGPGTSVSEVMRSGINRVMPRTGIQSILRLSSWNQYLALPVVDREGILLGELEHASIASAQPGVPSADSVQLNVTIGKAFFELYTAGLNALFTNLR